jgi:ribosomal protein S18 acetylase RimI-like enzyme
MLFVPPSYFAKKSKTMKTEITFKQFHDFKPAELFAIIRHIYLTSGFMSDDFDQKFSGIGQFDNYYRDILRQPGSFLLVAMTGNRPVGYLVVEACKATRRSHTANLNMGIIENFREKGIGKQLVNEALRRVEDEGVIRIIYLMVRTDHMGAVRLYETAGFEKLVKLVKDTKIGNDYFDGLMMRKFVNLIE